MKIIPVILAGGVGSRLWPISREENPKQFLKLKNGYNLLQNTILRVRDQNLFLDPIIICNTKYKNKVKDSLKEINVSPLCVILEPSSRNTAPALAGMCEVLIERNLNNPVLVMPADHVIKEEDIFHDGVKLVQDFASEYIITFGVTPDAPATGYGYIEKGAAVGDAFHISKFIEKPNLETSLKIYNSGNHFWNSGMFMFTAANFLAELMKFEPEMVANIKDTVKHAVHKENNIILDAEMFDKSKNISVDYALMERTSKALVQPLNITWQDIGSFGSLYKISDKDAENNYIQGNAITVDTKNSYVYSDNVLVATLGLRDIAVVCTKDAILVADLKQTERIKEVTSLLTDHNKTLPQVEQRPWGTFEVLNSGPGYKIKTIKVLPGGKLSLQSHEHRSEQWTVLKGIATVTCDEKIFDLPAGNSTFIPAKSKHRIENTHKEILEIIEIQLGGYLEEDDIVRYQDIYNRV